MPSLTLETAVNGVAGNIDVYSITLTPGSTYVFEYSGPDMLSIWTGSVAPNDGDVRSTGAWARFTPRSGSTFNVQISGWSPVGLFNFVPTTSSYTITARAWSFFDWWNVVLGKFKSKRP